MSYIEEDDCCGVTIFCNNCNSTEVGFAWSVFKEDKYGMKRIVPAFICRECGQMSYIEKEE